MALKRLKTKKSRRLPARQKYKILKNVREHNRKVRKEAKKSLKSKKRNKLIKVPNICPFKEEFLKEVEIAKNREEQEREKRKNMLKMDSEKSKSLESMVVDAEMREVVHTALHGEDKPLTEKVYKNVSASKENSLKAYFKEFKKVIENADVILEVVDARDPLGTRCVEVEKAVKSAPGNKKLVLVLNKADLIPRQNLQNWIKYFRKFGPVTAFKASTQDQAHNLGRRKFNQMNNEKAMQGSVCIGAELLMSMLGNYCRNKEIKTSIRVGVVGLPNVGKSSIINSLTRGRSCSVGSTPGVTRVMQEVELDSKIKLLDCPGIVFSQSSTKNHIPAVLKNAQRITDVEDPILVAESILQRASKQYFCKLYDITEYETYEEFFAKKAARMGKFVKGGVPNIKFAAQNLIKDWNTGKIKYCTQPPESSISDTDVHLSSAIVSADAREFEIENFEAMETDILNTFDSIKKEEVMEIISSGPVNLKIDEQDTNVSSRTSKILEDNDEEMPSKRKKNDSSVKKINDPVLLIEGNQSLNKSIKQLQKKKKKLNARNEKKVSNIANVLENFTIEQTDDDKYDFDEDYKIE